MKDLRKLRDLAGLTQQRAARAAVMARSRLSEIECGEVAPTLEEEERLRFILRRAIETRQIEMQIALDGDRK